MAGERMIQAVGTGAIESFTVAREMLRNSIHPEEHEPALSGARAEQLVKLKSRFRMGKPPGTGSEGVT